MAKKPRPDMLTPLEIRSLEDLGIIDELDDELMRAYLWSKGFYDMDWFTDFFLGHYKVDKKT